MTARASQRQLPPRRDQRVGPYIATALILVAVGLMTGRAEVMAVGAAIAVVVITGLTATNPLAIGTRVEPPPERVIVGRSIEMHVRVDVPDAAKVSAGVVGTSDDIGPARVRIVDSGEQGGTTLRITVPTRRWGRYRLGELIVRAEARGGMVVWQGGP